MGTLQAEKAGIVKDLQAARVETKDLRAKLDQRSTEMFAVLSELRDRLPTIPTCDPVQSTVKTRKARARASNRSN